MKYYKLPIPKEHLDLFFFAVRDKKDIIKLLMNTVKYISSNVYVHERIGANIHIVIDDMNRFIYESEHKVFSVRSPFSIREDAGSLYFYTASIANIDSATTSKILSFINDPRFYSPDSLEFISPLEELFDDLNEVWSFIRELMIFEDGYLRFDHDPEHALGRKHPLNHLDVCYSRASTFKIGMYRTPCAVYLRELLNNNLDAKFLERG